MKVITVHPKGGLNVFTKFQGYPSNSFAQNQNSQPHGDARQKVRGSLWIHHVGTMKVQCTQCCANPSRRC